MEDGFGKIWIDLELILYTFRNSRVWSEGQILGLLYTLVNYIGIFTKVLNELGQVTECPLAPPLLYYIGGILSNFFTSILDQIWIDLELILEVGFG